MIAQGDCLGAVLFIYFMQIQLITQHLTQTTAMHVLDNQYDEMTDRLKDSYEGSHWKAPSMELPMRAPFPLDVSTTSSS